MNAAIKGTTPGLVVAARVLPSGDVVLTTDNPATRKALYESPGWITALGTAAAIGRARFTVLVRHVARDAIDCGEQEASKRLIFSQNPRQLDAVDIIHIGTSVRGLKQAKKATSLVIDVASPMQANLLIEECLILNSTMHDAEVFHRDCIVVRCYRCHTIGHIARVCRCEVRCGFCAKQGDRDNNCPSREAGETAKCVNCARQHRVSRSGG